jgi:hypothetical protein
MALDSIGYCRLITGQIAGVSGYEASETCDSTDKEGEMAPTLHSEGRSYGDYGVRSIMITDAGIANTI